MASGSCCSLMDNKRGSRTNKRKQNAALALLAVVLVLVVAFSRESNLLPVLNNETAEKTAMDDETPMWNVTSTNITDHVNAAPVSGGLWMYVTAWEEGISSWRKSLAEIIIVAKRLNATVVEPCIYQGHLLSCDPLIRRSFGDGSPTSSTIKLGDVFNMTNLRTFYPKIVSYEEFEQAQRSASLEFQVFTMTMHHGSPIASIANLTSRAKQVYLPELEQAVKAAASNTVMSVLEVYYFRRGAFFNARHETTALVTRAEVNDFQALLDFRQEHYDRVDVFLQDMNIHPSAPFAAIHWRAEHPGMDHLKCASAILKARDVMSKNSISNSSSTAKPFVLISSLNLSPNLEWPVMRWKLNASSSDDSQSREALQILLDSGFNKLDTVLAPDKNNSNTIHDLTFLVVWDLILATKAESFATCSNDCPTSEVCTRCNYRGNMVEYTVYLRRRRNKSSFSCWPQ